MDILEGLVKLVVLIVAIPVLLMVGMPVALLLAQAPFIFLGATAAKIARLGKPDTRSETERRDENKMWLAALAIIAAFIGFGVFMSQRADDAAPLDPDIEIQHGWEDSRYDHSPR